MPLASIDEAIEAIREGKMVILVDDEARENEGDLVMAAESITPEAINFMAKFGRGLICLTLTEERLNELELPLMVKENASAFGTAFTISIEARHGVTTGISAADRAHTIKVAVDPSSRASDLVSPGHVFPLRARRGGVLERTGQTEGSVDLARLAGLKPAAVICEILNDDGTMARMTDLEVFAKEHDLLIVSVADLIEYRLQQDKLIEFLGEAPFPCRYGDDFKLRTYRAFTDGAEHLVMVLGDVSGKDKVPLVRVQHQCTVSDVFHGKDATCGWQLHGAMEQIAEHGCGVLVYLHRLEMSRWDAVKEHVLGVQEKKELSEEERQREINTVPSQFRNLGIGSQILADCGVKKMIVLSSSQPRFVGLDGFGLDVVDTLPIKRPSWSNEP